MYSYAQRSRCFWDRYNFTWVCRTEPSDDLTVLTTAVCSLKGSSGIKFADPLSTFLELEPMLESPMNKEMEEILKGEVVT
jgi:hypothetical protein